MQRTDIHQHLLGKPLIAELARRTRPPALIRRRGGWTFRLAGEAGSVLSIDATDADLRRAELRRDGANRALVALSSALGIETLPAEEAVPLLEAHQQGVDALPASFGAWGAVPLEQPDPGDVDALLARGVAGLSQAAWFAFLHARRRAHPRLRVLFAMLAGSAPLAARTARRARRAGRSRARPAGLLRHVLLRTARAAGGDRRRRRAWAPHVRHDADQRTYEQLLRDAHLDVWLLCWSHDHDTGFHDHDLSAGAVAVVSGSVREERLALGHRAGAAPIARTARAGSSFQFAASDIHRVLHAGDEPAVTIHAYSPPLVRMGAYVVEPDGRLRRHAISCEEELRPLEVASG